MFESRAAAREHLSSRRVFSTMDPAVFDIFIEECLVPVPVPVPVPVTSTPETSSDTITKTHNREKTKNDAVQLLVSNADEAEVYHRVPYEIPWLSEEILNQYGMSTSGKFYFTRQKNSILDPADLKWVESTFTNLVCQEFEHSHFWPLENIDHFSDMMASDIVDILVSDNDADST